MPVPTETAPEYEEIPVTIVDFGFAFGGTLSYTLIPGDMMTVGAKYIEIKFKDGSEAEIVRANIAFRTTRDSIVKKPLKQQRPVVRRTAPEPDETVQ